MQLFPDQIPVEEVFNFASYLTRCPFQFMLFEPWSILQLPFSLRLLQESSRVWLFLDLAFPVNVIYVDSL